MWSTVPDKLTVKHFPTIRGIQNFLLALTRAYQFRLSSATVNALCISEVKFYIILHLLCMKVAWFWLQIVHAGPIWCNPLCHMLVHKLQCLVTTSSVIRQCLLLAVHLLSWEVLVSHFCCFMCISSPYKWPVLCWLQMELVCCTWYSGEFCIRHNFTLCLPHSSPSSSTVWAVKF
jgi:hypothetical protein